MADETVVHIGENSPERIAYKLFQHIADAENMALVAKPISADRHVANRKWILDTFAECLTTVRLPHTRKQG